MKTKSVPFKSSTETKGTEKRTTAAQQARKIKTAQAKDRARHWAANRRARNHPIAVATEITTEVTEGRTHVLQTLQVRRTQLLKELSDIDTAIAVIQRTC